MTLATQADYRIELIDNALVTRALLDEAHGVAYALGLYGYGRQGGLALHVDSIPARMIRDEVGHWYVRVYRKGVYLRTYMVERDDYGYEPNAAKEEDYLELTLTTAEHVFERVECLPDPASGPPIEPFVTPDLPLDDAVKWIVNHACGPDAYDSPLGASRVMPGLTIEAYASAHPTSQIVEVANRMNLYEFLVQFCVAWEIDFSLDLVETTGDANEWVFRTYTPRRGLDKSEANGARDPVIINDTSLNIISGRRHRDHLFATTVVSRALDNEITDAALEAAYGRHEVIADSNDPVKMAAILHENRQRLGSEWAYSETANCQIVDHFMPGDLVTTNNLRLGMPVENQMVKEIYVTLTDQGDEQVEIVFGEYEKTINDQSGGGAVKPDDPYEDLSDEDPEPIAAASAPGTEEAFSRSDHKHRGVLLDDAGAEVQPSAGAFKVNGVDGITAVKDPADPSRIKISGAGIGANVSFYGDDSPVVAGMFDPDDSYKFGVKGGTGCSTTILADPNNHYLTINTVWQRTAGDVNWLGPATNTDKVVINAATAPLSAATWLYVHGDIEVESTLKAYNGRLYLSGQDGTIDCYTDGVATTFNVDDGAGVAQIGLLATGTSYFNGGDLIIGNAHDFALYADGEGASLKLSITGANGNVWLEPAATLHIGGYTYTWPTDGAVTGDYLRATVSGATVALSWETAVAAAHNLFSATHGDTTGAADPVDGDIIIGNATPKWSKLAISAPAANVRNVLGVDNAETRPSWKTALDGTNPATLTAAAAAAPGTSLIFAHRDHVHPITTTTAAAASTIVATDANGYITAARFVFDASEYIAPAAGTIAYNASNFHRFYIGATQHLIVQDGYVFPGVANNTQLGQSSYRWSNVYSVLGNYSGQITSSLATGTAPLAVTSTTKCTNLNADYLDGYHASSSATNNTIALRDASGGLDMVQCHCDSFLFDGTISAKSTGAYSHNIYTGVGTYYFMVTNKP